MSRRSARCAIAPSSATCATSILDAYLRDTDRASVLVGERYEPVPVEPADSRVSAQQELLLHYAEAAAPAQTPLNE